MRMPGPSGTHWTLDVERAGRDFSDRDVQLVDAVRPAFIAYEAQRQLTTKIARLQADRQEAVSDGPLSTREQQVLDLVADGASNAEIAWRLRIAPGTVKKHLEHIYAKLDVGSRTGALARTGRAVPVPGNADRRLTLD
jgi:ATP/maltotriose-dependent transcriptional regulator MalT